MGMAGLYVGLSGLQTSSNSLNTTANNLANVNTSGYVQQLQGRKVLVFLLPRLIMSGICFLTPHIVRNMADRAFMINYTIRFLR